LFENGFLHLDQLPAKLNKPIDRFIHELHDTEFVRFIDSSDGEENIYIVIVNASSIPGHKEEIIILLIEIVPTRAVNHEAITGVKAVWVGRKELFSSIPHGDGSRKAIAGFKDNISS
jgi:hypothetical protein